MSDGRITHIPALGKQVGIGESGSFSTKSGIISKSVTIRAEKTRKSCYEKKRNKNCRSKETVKPVLLMLAQGRGTTRAG